MPSPNSKADFERMRSDFLHFLGRVKAGGMGDARRSSDLVLERAADGAFGLPPKHDFERDGPIHIGWDLGADDISVVSFFDGEQWTHEQVDRAKLLRGELGTITGFTITETKKR